MPIATALDLSAEAGYEGEYTNNTTRTDTDKVGEWIHRPKVNARLDHSGDAIQASANYSARRDIHQEAVFNDRTYVTGRAEVTWQALPNRLSFNVFNARTETSINSTLPDSQDNRQTTDTTGAGTTLTIPSIGSQYIQFGYKYSMLSRDETDSDSNRQSTNLSYLIPISENRTLSLTANYGDIDFDNPFSPDYVSKSGSIQYASASNSLDVSFSMGYTQFERGLQRKDANGTTGNASLTWRTTGVTSLTASYSRSLDDNSLDTVRGTPEFGERFTEDSTLNEVFTQDNLQLSLNTAIGHNQIHFSGYLRNKDYEDISSDEERKNISLTATRKLQSNVSGRLFLSVMRVDVDNSNRDYDEYRAGASVTWGQIKNLNVTASVTYGRRDSDAVLTEYEEVSGKILLMYTLLERNR